jgi:hypothetical protein
MAIPLLESKIGGSFCVLGSEGGEGLGLRPPRDIEALALTCNIKDNAPPP